MTGRLVKLGAKVMQMSLSMLSATSTFVLIGYGQSNLACLQCVVCDIPHSYIVHLISSTPPPRRPLFPNMAKMSLPSSLHFTRHAALLCTHCGYCHGRRVTSPSLDEEVLVVVWPLDVMTVELMKVHLRMVLVPLLTRKSCCRALFVVFWMWSTRRHISPLWNVLQAMIAC